ncbi:PrgI family protein, partial [Nocardia nova]
RPDRIVGPFTARQLGLLAGTGLVLLLAWAATRALVPITLFAGFAAPIAAVATAIVLTTRDGLSGDQLLLAALRHLGRDRHLIAAHPGDEHNGTPPRWLTDRAHGPLPPAAHPITCDTTALPRSISAGSGGLGVVDLGEEGIAVIAAATTINLALRTPGEQAGLVAALGNYLQSLSGGVQILLRSVRQDVTGRISDLRLAAQEMSPELADYARDHARHLAELADDDTAAQRQVLLIWREPLDPVTRLAASVLGGLTARGRDERRIAAHA